MFITCTHLIEPSLEDNQSDVSSEEVGSLEIENSSEEENEISSKQTTAASRNGKLNTNLVAQLSDEAKDDIEISDR